MVQFADSTLTDLSSIMFLPGLEWPLAFWEFSYQKVELGIHLFLVQRDIVMCFWVVSMYSNVTASHLVIGMVSRNTPPPTMLNRCMIQRCRPRNIKVIEHALRYPTLKECQQWRRNKVWKGGSQELVCLPFLRQIHKIISRRSSSYQGPIKTEYLSCQKDIW